MTLRMHKDPKYRGILYSVKVGDTKGTVHSIFSEALVDAFAEQLGKRLPDEAAAKIADFLIDELKMGASGQATDVREERFNSIVRAGNAVSIPMAHHLEEMLKEAKAKSRDNDVARGRMRGLAQALAFVRAPESWLGGSNRKRLEMIKKEEAIRP